MIKAEVISHEGNPGPNWLDHCRTIATPINITVVLLLVIVGSLFIGITRHQRISTANQQSTPAAGQASVQPHTTSLQVQPLRQETTAVGNANTNVQSAAGGQGPVANPNAQDKSSDVLGAAKTPALNNSRANKRQQTPAKKAQQQLTQLQGQLQSTTQDIDNALSNLTNR